MRFEYGVCGPSDMKKFGKPCAVIPRFVRKPSVDHFSRNVMPSRPRAAAGALGAALIRPFVGIEGNVLLSLVGLIRLASAAFMLSYRTAVAGVVA